MNNEQIKRLVLRFWKFQKLENKIVKSFVWFEAKLAESAEEHQLARPQTHKQNINSWDGSEWRWWNVGVMGFVENYSIVWSAEFAGQ